jgi:cation transport regulator ChaC
MLVSDGSSEIVAAIISAAIGLGGVGLAYVLSKGQEINANIRQKKQEKYDDLVNALTDITATPIYGD